MIRSLFSLRLSHNIHQKCAFLSTAAKSFELGISRNSVLTVISRANGPRTLKIGLPSADREPSFDLMHITASENVLADGSSDSYTVVQLPLDSAIGTENSTCIEIPPDCNVLIKDESHNGELNVHVSGLENSQISVQNVRGKTTFSKIKTTKLAAASQFVDFQGNCTIKDCILRNESISLQAKMLHVDKLTVLCDVLDARIEAIYSNSTVYQYEDGSIQSKFSHGSFDIEKIGGGSGKIHLGCLNGNANVRVPHGTCDLHAFAFKFGEFSATLYDGLIHVDIAQEDFDDKFQLHLSKSAENVPADSLEIEASAPRIELAQSIHVIGREEPTSATQHEEFSVIPEKLVGTLVSSNPEKKAKRHVKAHLHTGIIRLGVSSWPDWLLRARRS